MTRPRAPASRVCWLRGKDARPRTAGAARVGAAGVEGEASKSRPTGWASRQLPCVVCVGQEAAQGNTRCIDAHCDHLLFYEWLKRDVK